MYYFGDRQKFNKEYMYANNTMARDAGYLVYLVWAYCLRRGE